MKEFREGPVVEEEVESFLANVRSTVGYDRENVLRERNKGRCGVCVSVWSVCECV